jgi:hypothetical protein
MGTISPRAETHGATGPRQIAKASQGFRPFIPGPAGPGKRGYIRPLPKRETLLLIRDPHARLDRAGTQNITCLAHPGWSLSTDPRFQALGGR